MSNEDLKQHLRENRDSAHERASEHHRKRNFWLEQAKRAEQELQRIERRERLGGDA